MGSPADAILAVALQPDGKTVSPVVVALDVGHVHRGRARPALNAGRALQVELEAAPGRWLFACRMVLEPVVQACTGASDAPAQPEVRGQLRRASEKAIAK